MPPTASEIRAIRADCDAEFVTVCDLALAGNREAVEDVADVIRHRRPPPCPERQSNLAIYSGPGGLDMQPTDLPVGDTEIGVDVPCLRRVIPLTDAMWDSRRWHRRHHRWVWDLA